MNTRPIMKTPSEEMKERILNLSQDLICIAGMDGYFKYLNPAWENILGYTRDELLSRPFLDFIHPDDHAKNDLEVEKLSRGQPTLDFENRYLCKDGSLRYIQWTATPVPAEKVMYCIGRDITERKQAEEKLKESEALTRVIVENSLNAIVVADDSGNYVLVNKAAAEMFGYTQEQLLHMNVGQIKTTTTPDALEKYRRYLEKGQEIGEFDFLRQDDESRIAQYHAVRIRENFNLSILSDITEAKRAEEQLRESEKRFSTVFQASPTPITSRLSHKTE